MIRDFKNEDLKAIIDLLQGDYVISMEGATSEFTGDNRRMVICEEDKIKGFALMVNNKGSNKWTLKLYVNPDYRKKGIGTALYEKAMEYLTEAKADGIVVGFKVDGVDGEDDTNFYKKLGYEKWFGYHDMRYMGEVQPEVNLNFINYEDKYFEKYETLMGEAFYQLREANNMKPYNCSDFSDKQRQYWMNNKNYVYLLLDEKDEIITTITVKDGFIDEVMTSKGYEGKGYGKKAVQFGINKALSEGVKNIQLCVVEWNEKARKLYERLGFETIQTFHNYRKSLV